MRTPVYAALLLVCMCYAQGQQITTTDSPAAPTTGGNSGGGGDDDGGGGYTTTADTPTTTSDPDAVDLRWLAIVADLMGTSSQSFNDSYHTIVEQYPSVPREVFENTYFNFDFMTNSSSRPETTSLTSDKILEVLSIIIDVLDDPSVNLTTREVLVTAAFVQDLSAALLLEMSGSELTADSGEFESVMSYIIEICDILLDETYIDLWIDIRRAYPAYASVIETVDVVSLTIANLISTPGELKSDVKNIDYHLVKDSWYNLTSSGREYVFQVGDNEGVFIPHLYLQDAPFEPDDVVALVGVQYKDVSDLMGKNLTRASVSASIRDQSSYNPTVLTNDVISMTAVRVPDFSSTSIPVFFRFGHTEKRLDYYGVACAFWNFDKFPENGGVWDDEGCESVNQSSGAWSTQCMCNHTTNFGLLLLKHDPAYVDWHFIIQTWMWSIGAGVSVIPLFPFLGFIIYLTTVNPKRRSAQINFLLSLIMMLLVLATNEIAKWQNLPYVCMGFGIGMHLFTISTFSWLFVISVLLFTRVTNFTDREANHCVSFLIGWGIPAVTVGATAAQLYTEYGLGTRCWFNDASQIALAFMVPVLAIGVLTIILLIASMRAIVQSGQITLFEREKEELFKLRSTCACFLIIAPELLVFYLAGQFSFTNPMIGYVFGALLPFQGIIVVVSERRLNKELEEAYKLKLKPPEILKDEYDIWAEELDEAVRADSSLAKEAEYYGTGRARSRQSVLSMRGIKLARAAGGASLANGPPKMVGGKGTRNTKKKKKRRKKQPNGAEDSTEVIALPTGPRQQADGESRGRNSTEPPMGGPPPSKPKIGFVTTDYSELDEEGPSYLKKKSAHEVAATLPKSPAPRTPGRTTPGRTTPGRKTPTSARGGRKSSTASRSPLPRSPSLPGAPDDDEETYGQFLAPTPRKKSDGSSPIGDRMSPEGAVNEGYADEDGDYYDDEYYDENGDYYDENGEYYGEDDEYYDENGEYYGEEGEYDEEYDENY